MKEESEKIGLKLNIQKTKIMASGPITSWEIDGETVETVSDFILGGSKTTADGDHSHEIKRCLLLETIALTRWTFVGKVMSLLFHMLSRLVITFLPRSKHLLISGMQSPCSDFGAAKNSLPLFPHLFPIK